MRVVDAAAVHAALGYASLADALAEAEAECEAAGGEAKAVTGDVTQPEDCERLIAKTTERFGGIDFLISNAGLSMWAQFDEVKDLSIFRRLMEVNYLGLVHTLHFALPALKKTGGLIVSIGSIQGKIAVPAHSGYVASKHALEGLVDTLRSELHGTGINFLQVYPDWIRGTGMRQNALGSHGQAVGDRKHDHGGAGVTVDECARAILRTMAKGRSSLYIPRKLQYVSCLKMFFPGLLRWGIRRRLNTQK